MPELRDAEPGTEAPIYETSPRRVAAYLGLGLAAVVALFVLGWDIALVRWVAVIFGIVVMITLHELGHFLTAKWSGMKVTEFFIGFGPRLWSFHRGETEYGIKPIPAGAYVRIVGMNNLDEVAPEDEPRSYRQQSFPRRLLVVLAGPATHFVQAGLIIFVLLAFVGVPGGSLTDDPDAEDWVVDSVTSDSAAAEAGLRSGDRVVAFDGTPVSTFEEMTDLIKETEVGEEVTLTVERGGRTFDTTTEIGGRPRDLSGPGVEAGSPFLGVGQTFTDERLGVGEALVETPQETLGITGQALAALGRFFSPSGLDSFADSVSDGAEEERSQPGSSSGSSSSDDSSDEGRLLSIFGAIRLGAEVSANGAYLLLGFFLSINIFVGLVNLVPLLPFDGGHAAVAIYERIRSRRGQRYQADVTKLLPFAYAVIMALVVLFVTTSYLDFVDPVDL